MSESFKPGTPIKPLVTIASGYDIEPQGGSQGHYKDAKGAAGTAGGLAGAEAGAIAGIDDGSKDAPADLARVAEKINKAGADAALIKISNDLDVKKLIVKRSKDYDVLISLNREESDLINKREASGLNEKESARLAQIKIDSEQATKDTKSDEINLSNRVDVLAEKYGVKDKKIQAAITDYIIIDNNYQEQLSGKSPINAEGIARQEVLVKNIDNMSASIKGDPKNKHARQELDAASVALHDGDFKEANKHLEAAGKQYEGSHKVELLGLKGAVQNYTNAPIINSTAPFLGNQSQTINKGRDR